MTAAVPADAHGNIPKSPALTIAQPAEYWIVRRS
jgi:hypothetical protein